MAERIFGAIGRSDLLTDARYRDNASRLQHVDDLDAILGTWIAGRDFEEVVQRFEDAGAPLAPIYDIHQIFADPQVHARGTLVTLQDPDLGPIRMQNVIARLSRTPGEIRWAGPRLGEHNTAVYVQELGLTPSELAQLQAKGVV